MPEANSPSKGSPTPRRAGLSLRRVSSPRTVRVSLLKPILNIARFFVGDTIPRVDSAQHIHALLAELRERNVPVKEAEKGVLTKLMILLLKAERAPDQEDKCRALRLLAGLIVSIVEDDYFFMPEVTEHASLEKLEGLARKLEMAQGQRLAALQETIAKYQIVVTNSFDLDGLLSILPDLEEELIAIITRCAVQLREGERILATQRDEARAERHRARLAEAYVRTRNLVARLVCIPDIVDHPRLRRRIIQREQKRIELDALGAAVISERDQAIQAKSLLETTEQDRGETVDAENREAVAAQLAAIQADSPAEPAIDSDEDEDAGWFFDID